MSPAAISQRSLAWAGSNVQIPSLLRGLTPAVFGSFQPRPISQSAGRKSSLLSSKGLSFPSHSLHRSGLGIWKLEKLMMAPKGVSAEANGSSMSTQAMPDDLEYQMPPPEMSVIVDAPPTPAISFSPNRDDVLLLHRTSLPSIEELAKPELRLAGLRIDAQSYCRSRMASYTGISLAKMSDLGPGVQISGTAEDAGLSRPLSGIPPGAKINYVSWSPNAAHIAFCIRDSEEGPGSKFSLWVASIETGEARPLLPSTTRAINSVFETYSWLDDMTLVVCAIPQSPSEPPVQPRAPRGPTTQSNAKDRVIPARTYQDLLKNAHDENLFEFYGTSEILIVTLDGAVKSIGAPNMYTSVRPSPDGNVLLVTTMQRPFSFRVPCGRFPRRVEVWDREGRVLRLVADLPMAEGIPLAHESVRTGPRDISWRPDRPSTVYWAETQDGGDAKVEANPRDIVYSLELDAAAAADAEPTVFTTTELRYSGIAWADERLALVYERWYKTRRSRTWVIVPGDLSLPPRVLFDRSYEDVYSDPGQPVTRRHHVYGTYVLARFSSGGGDARGRLLLDGNGATPDGNVPFLDLLDIDTGEKERIWQSDKETKYERLTAIMSDFETPDDQDLQLDKLRILVSSESKRDPPQFHLIQWPSREWKQVTNFPHPYPQLIDAAKDIIRYKRTDGVDLTATLYLPPNYKPGVDGPLSVLLWAYPREFKSKAAAGQVRRSANTFPGIGSTSPLLWLARGWAILDGPAFPIVGEEGEEPNDTYLEQLVSSAEAAIDEVVRRGITERHRVAVGGHSYGAAMTANLLAHAPGLFAAGLANSGAYNRTLTPFGFQSEDRSLWEVPETYAKMSPFMHANKIKTPILMIHGQDDNNSGTFPMQSERLFAALQGHGALARLVLLPHEGHGYRARESVMHALWEMDTWLSTHVPGAGQRGAFPVAPAAEGTANGAGNGAAGAGEPVVVPVPSAL